jgi:hypothetical protein
MSTDSENVKRKQESSWIRYRRAILSRDHFRAFDLIPTILRFDPGNKDALAEQHRLAGKLSRQLAEEITAAIRARDPKQAASLLRRRKRLPSEYRPRSPELEECWNLARPALIVDAKRESGKLIARAREYRLQGDSESWKQIDELLKQVGIWCESVDIDPEKELDADSSEFKTLKEWVEAGQRRAKIHELTEKLREVVGQVEERCASARWRHVKSLRELHSQLGEMWRDIVALNVVIPAETSALYETGRSLLEKKIASLRRKHRLAVTTFVASLIGVSLFAGVGVLALLRAQRIAAHLQHLQQDGLVGRHEEPEAEDAGADGYVRYLGIHDPYMLLWGVVTPVLDRTTNWIGRVRVAQEEWGKQLDGLHPLAQRSFSMFEGSAVTNLIARFAEVTTARTKVIETVFQLNPSLQTELGEDVILQRTQLGDRHEEWRKYCDRRDRFYEQEGMRIARELKELLERGEGDSGMVAQPGNVLRSLRSVRQSLQVLSEVLAEYKKKRGPRVPQVRVPDEPELQKRADDLERHRAMMQSNMEGIDRAINGMKIADSTEDYLRAMRSYGEAGKALSLQETRAAERVGESLTGGRQLLGAILMPHDPAGFDFFSNNPAASMTPTNVTTEESKRFLILRDDDNLRNVYKYDWMPRSAPSATGQNAYSIGPAEERSRIGPVITYTGVFPYCPDGRVGVMSRGAGAKSPESELFARCGVGLLADSRVSRFTTPILQVMDAVDADTQVSPLFKAYLQVKLYEFVMLRPREWGAHWIATLRADQAQLLGAGADGLQSDDWMQPEKNQFRMSRLERHYLQRRNRLPYLKQAQAMRELVSSVYFQQRFAGYVDEQGMPQVRGEIENTGELWGLEQRTLKPALLFRAGSGQQPWIKARPAQPMTPLLLMPSGKAAILERAARNMDLKPDDPAIRSWLPPFFQAN